ncbi:MAG: SDR family oxidoreductase [Polyangiales bacterium]
MLEQRNKEVAMLIFVTGATGLLGNNVIRTLLSQGHEVRGLVRDGEKGVTMFAPRPPRLTLIEGDMEHIDSLHDALDGVECVVHTAAYFRDSYKGGEHYQRMLDVNVRGTKALLEAAYLRGVRRFVHVSSTATVKGPPGGITREDMRRSFDGEPDDYYRSKILSDKVVESFAEEHAAFHVSYVLPGFMVGPGDLGPTSSGRLVLDFAQGKLPGIMNAGFSFVDARDVAGACAKLCTEKKPNERYLVAGRYHSLRDTYASLAPITKAPLPTRSIPDFALLVYAFVCEIYARVSGKPVLVSWAGARSMIRERGHSEFDSSKAERELGVVFRPFEETLRDTFDDYVRRGWLPSANAGK